MLTTSKLRLTRRVRVTKSRSEWLLSQWVGWLVGGLVSERVGHERVAEWVSE